MSNKKDTWDSEHYSKNPSLQKHDWALDALEKNNLIGNENILDIGCGNGDITAKIAQKVPRGKVLGIDLSPSMIKMAKESYAHVSNLSFEIADATNFSFNQKFAYVVCFFVLHWIDDQLAVLKNIKNALKPGGKTIIIMAMDQKDSPVSLAFANLEHEGTWETAIKNNTKRHHPQTVEGIGKLLDQSGLKNKEIRIITRKSGATSLDSAVQAFMRWIPHSTELPQNEALKFSHALARNMYKQLKKEPNEPIEFSAAFLLIEAQKN